jgi:hypothetical protein
MNANKILTMTAIVLSSMLAGCVPAGELQPKGADDAAPQIGFEDRPGRDIDGDDAADEGGEVAGADAPADAPNDGAADDPSGVDDGSQEP